MQLIGQVHEPLLISDVFQHDHIVDIERNISTVAVLMKHILRK